MIAVDHQCPMCDHVIPGFDDEDHDCTCLDENEKPVRMLQVRWKNNSSRVYIRDEMKGKWDGKN